MGDLFKPDVTQVSPEITQESLLSGIQEALHGQLGQFLSDLLSQSGRFGGLQRSLLGQLEGKDGSQKLAGRKLDEILRGKPTDTEELFRKGILAPALRAFDQEIRPRIDQGFARHGASFGTRRGVEVGRQLGNVQAGAQGQLAALQTQMIESAKRRQFAAIGIPLQQTLSRIGGLGALSSLGVGPALQFGNQRTFQNFQSQAFGQPGIGSQLLGLGGQLGSAALLGK